MPLKSLNAYSLPNQKKPRGQSILCVRLTWFSTQPFMKRVSSLLYIIYIKSVLVQWRVLVYYPNLVDLVSLHFHLRVHGF